jgi:ferredoxin
MFKRLSSLKFTPYRYFHYTPQTFYKVTYILPTNEHVTVDCPSGTNLLELAHKHDIELEGACECSLACSTCHVIVKKTFFDMLEDPSDEENDMLDLAFGLTETYCSILITGPG